ncbi:MAG TPA: amidase family protein [Acidimicrobiales bacterium]|nr:amidase family protein [Acidimicrobiales bacterium]
MDPTSATTTELTLALHEKQISSREVLDALLAHVEKRNPALNAVVTLDVDRALVAAAAADAATARGAPAGALHGLPMTVKDVYETEGLVTTSGALELKDHMPTTDALAVGRLKQAGAIVFGKTNTPMYAGDIQTYNDVFGRTNNPWDTSRTTGGSSGGSAAAIAAGLSPLELGSDIGGSIRNPAHFSGVYGLKPSWGVVPSRGHIPGPPGNLIETDVNCNGPLARSLADLQLALGVLAGPVPEDAAGWRLELDPGAPIGDASSLRIATVFDGGDSLLPVAAEVRTILDAFAAGADAAGAKVEPATLPVTLTDGFRAWQDLVLPIIGSGLSDEEYAAFTPLDSVEGDDPAINAGRAMVSRYRTWLVANARRQHQRAAWAGLFERYDAVLAPVMPTAAFPHDTERSILERTVDVDGTAVPHLTLIAWCGAIGAMLLPVVTLPAGRTPSGLPVGVQVIGPFLSDARLLRIGEVLDEAGPGFTAPPTAS